MCLREHPQITDGIECAVVRKPVNDMLAIAACLHQVRRLEVLEVLGNVLAVV